MIVVAAALVAAVIDGTVRAHRSSDHWPRNSISGVAGPVPEGRIELPYQPAADLA